MIKYCKMADPAGANEGAERVPDTKVKASERALDALLRQTPDQMLRVLEDGSFERSLARLRDEEAPDPAWVRARARTLRLKSGCAAAELRELALRLRDALAAWLADGGSDTLREAQAELTLRQLTEKTAELERMQTQMRALIRQTERAEEAAETAELLQALRRFREYGREAEE